MDDPPPTLQFESEAQLSGRLATAVVGWYRDRFGRGPTRAKGWILDDNAAVILGNVQTEVERSLVSAGETESVELLRRRVRQVYADELQVMVQQIVGRKVVAMLGDHSAVANTTIMLFVLEPDGPQPDAPELGSEQEAIRGWGDQVRRQNRSLRDEQARLREEQARLSEQRPKPATD
jgi:uncharacterized protein YbcI